MDDTFTHFWSGRTAQAAFDELLAVTEPTAQSDPDHDGPDGSVLDKIDFVMIDLPSGFDPADRPSVETSAQQLLDARDVRIADPHGPAGCFDLGNGEWFFFGFAPAPQ